MGAMVEADCPFVSRGGLKLAAALAAWGVDPNGWTCADLGCSTGGFTDCLLQRGAARVYAVDTAYGQLAWKLRQDPRVTVLERTNALHFDPWGNHDPKPQPGPTHQRAPAKAVPPLLQQPCDLVVVDLGWTRQKLALPAARRWLQPHGNPALKSSTLLGPGSSTLLRPEGSASQLLPGVIVTLIKPQYEVGDQPMRGRRAGVLNDAVAAETAQRVAAEMQQAGWVVQGLLPAAIRGSAAGGRPGNQEYLALVRPG